MATVGGIMKKMLGIPKVKVALVAEKAMWVEPMIIVEHKLHQLMKIANRIIVLNFGIIIANGTPQEIVNNQEVIEAYLGEGD
jgi:ABC-type branched-subunit amino acid transport system ATPase component